MNDPLLAALAAAGFASEAPGFVASNVGFERSDGMTQAFTGDHRSPAFAWDHDEPGGAAR